MKIYADYQPKQDIWVTMNAYSILIDEKLITIPKHYRTDLASVPKLFWIFVAIYELGITPPIVHDFLYKEARLNRKKADDLFLKMMKKEQVKPRKMWAAYWSVRFFGWIPYYITERKK